MAAPLDCLPPASLDVHAAVASLRDAELAWLRGLPPAVKLLLFPDEPPRGPDWPAHHVVTLGCMALTLVGQKPCALLLHGSWPAFGRELEDAVVRPWLARFRITHLSLHTVEGETVPVDGGWSGNRFKGSVVLLGDNHPDAGLARYAFLSGRARVPNKLIGRALGYPGRDGEESCTVYYDARDKDPFRAPGASPDALCCVPLVEHRARAADAAAVGRHFAACDAALSPAGLPLRLDLTHCALWCVRAFLECVTAALGWDEQLMAAIDDGRLMFPEEPDFDDAMLRLLQPTLRAAGRWPAA